MSEVGHGPNDASSLDRVVDGLLARDHRAADWLQSAGEVRQAATSTAGRRGGSRALPDNDRERDPFQRLFSSQFGKRALSNLGNESKSLASVGMLAANVLCGLIARGGMRELLRRDLPPSARQLVVFHGQSGLRNSVLVLDPSLDPGAAPTVAPSAGIGQLVRNAKDLIAPALTAFGSSQIDEGDALEALWIARPRVLVAPAPKLIDTCVQRPAAQVTCGNSASTSGAYARDANGTPGVTVCWHATGPAGKQVQIDGVDRTVSSASEALDTCFVALPEDAIPHAKLTVGKKGVLAKRAPGAQERHTFWAAAGQEKEARIVAADYGVPLATPKRQLCVYTNAVTNYGDSGGALINDDDYLVGFCFQRTPFGAPMEFATWIWAGSAFLELGLQPL